MDDLYYPVTLKELKFTADNSNNFVFDASHEIYGDIKAKIFKFQSLHDVSTKLREVFTNTKLKHPFVTQVLDVGVVQNREDLELVCSCEMFQDNLKTEICTKSEWQEMYTESELWDFLYFTVEALAEAQVHVYPTQELSHKDLKPETIFKRSSGEYRIAEVTHASQTIMNFGLNTIRGSFAYMSPTMRDAITSSTTTLTCDPYRSDIYSIGLTVLSMATLHVFELSDNINQSILMKIIESISYSDLLKQVIVWMLMEHESDRPDFKSLNAYLQKMKGGQQSQDKTLQLDELLSKISTNVKMNNEATAMLASYLEDLWTTMLLKKWKVDKKEDMQSPQFFMRKMELLEKLAAIPAYEISSQITTFDHEFIAITEFLSDFVIEPVVQFIIERQQSDKSFQLHHTIDTHTGSFIALSTEGFPLFTIRKDHRTITITEPPACSPAVMIRIPRRQLELLHLYQLYRIADIMLIISDISESSLSIQFTSNDPQFISSQHTLRSSLEEITIGRGAACSIKLPHASLSHKHAVIRLSEKKWGIEDLDSTNGTWKYCHTTNSVGRESNSVRVEDGQLLYVAETVYRCSLKG